LSSYFIDKPALERFLVEILPPLHYLELSSLQLGEDLISKCSEKFHQTVVFGSPDLPHNKRQHLTTKYNITVSIIFAKDFPVNLQPIEIESDESMKAGG